MADNPGIKPNRFRWSCHPDMEIRVLNLMKREFHEEVSGKRLSSKLWTSLEKRINDDQIQARSIMMWFRALKNQYLAFKEDPSLQPPKHFELLDSIFGKADFIRKKPATGKGSDVKINFKEFDQTAENDDGINLNIFRFRPVLKKPALKPTAMNLQPIPMEEIEDNLERNALHSFCQSNQQNQVLAPDELPLDEMIKKSRIKSLEPIPVALDTHEEEPEDIADIMKKVKADTKTSSSTSIFTKQPVLITPRRVLINPSNIGQFYAQAKNHPTPVLKIDGKKADKPQRLILDFEPVIPAPATPLVEQEIIEPVKKQSRKQKIECFVCKIKITRESQNQHYAICLENSLLPNPNHANTVNLEKVLDQFKSCIYCKTDISPKLASLKLGHLKNCASLDELGLSTLIEEIKLLHCSLSEQTQFVKPTIKYLFT